MGQVSAVDIFGDQGAGYADGCWRILTIVSQSWRTNLELRVDEIAKSVLDGSTELQVLTRSVKNLEHDEVAYRHLRPLHDRVTHLERCLS